MDSLIRSCLCIMMLAYDFEDTLPDRKNAPIRLFSCFPLLR